MRLFIAIQFTPEIKKELTRFQNDLKRNGLTGRFVPVENLHLTLAFIGEYPNPDDVLDVLGQVPFTPFKRPGGLCKKASPCVSGERHSIR